MSQIEHFKKAKRQPCGVIETLKQSVALVFQLNEANALTKHPPHVFSLLQIAKKTSGFIVCRKNFQIKTTVQSNPSTTTTLEALKVVSVVDRLSLFRGCFVL
jgi:hypothetical protein